MNLSLPAEATRGFRGVRICVFSAIGAGLLGLSLPWATATLFGGIEINSGPGIDTHEGRIYFGVLAVAFVLALFLAATSTAVNLLVMFSGAGLATAAIYFATRIPTPSSGGPFGGLNSASPGYGMYLDAAAGIAIALAVLLGMMSGRGSVVAPTPRVVATNAAPTVASTPLPGGAPAQWAPDPAGSGMWRFWDGAQWTGHLSPGEAAPAPSTEGADAP